jgi:hypothetical protein
MQKETKTTMDNKSIKSEVNVIDLILKSQSADFDEKGATAKKLVIDASNFFTEKNIGGPIIKPDWLKMVKGMAKYELQSHKSFLEKLTNGEKVDANPFEGVDKEGRNYLWATFRYKNGNQNFKVLTTGSMCKFIGMYQLGMFTVNLSLESLYAEALKK